MAVSSNPIVLENAKPGNPESEWDISGAGSSNIEGFATDISTDNGQRVDFKINTNSTNYRIDIYRVRLLRRSRRPQGRDDPASNGNASGSTGAVARRSDRSRGCGQLAGLRVLDHPV